jgi:hypothetical protein
LSNIVIKIADLYAETERWMKKNVNSTEEQRFAREKNAKTEIVEILIPVLCTSVLDRIAKLPAAEQGAMGDFKDAPKS